MSSEINHDHYPDDYLMQILTDVKSIAVVGASARPERDSHLTMQALIDEGYEVFPVNPREAGRKILGRFCYPTLASIGHAVDMVDIFRASDAALDVTKQAIEINANVVWMQLGIRNDRAAELASAAGLRVVMNRCPKIEFAKPYWTGRAI